ncbi:hypothetical protein CAP35_13795 [Chitinophagaceae bacterium IBVUCB1]|nr:hypothetical protein CAP35_13795 [Chitinophagaceae bacterium IBVUCB1]
MAVITKKKAAVKNKHATQKKAAKKAPRKRRPRKIEQMLNAEIMFVNYQMTAKAIAETLNITEKTIGDWRAKGGWDAKRDEFFASPLKIRQLLLTEMKRIAEGEPASIDADSLSKIVKAFEATSDKLSPPIIVAAMQMLDNFMAEYNPELAVQCLDAHRAFIQHVISING